MSGGNVSGAVRTLSNPVISQVRSAKNLSVAPLNEYTQANGSKNELPLEMKDYLKKMKLYADTISDTVLLLMLRKATASFAQTKAASENDDKISVNSKPTYEQDNKNESFFVKIDNIAVSQKSESVSMDSFKRDFAANKTYELNIKTNDKETMLKISANQFDYNKSMMNKLARAVNGSEIGVTASVESAENKSKLMLESDFTGQPFETTGSLADLFKLHTSVKAENATYSINNGDERVSNSNYVEISENLYARLKEASDDQIKINFTKDTEDTKKSLRKLAVNFNSLLELSSSERKYEKLYNQLSTLTASYADDLGAAGLDIQEDGSMRYNENRVDKSISNGNLAKLFSDSRSDIAPSFGQILKAVSDKANGDPGTYLSNDPIGSNKARFEKDNTDYLNIMSAYSSSGMYVNNTY